MYTKTSEYSEVSKLVILIMGFHLVYITDKKHHQIFSWQWQTHCVYTFRKCLWKTHIWVIMIVQVAFKVKAVLHRNDNSSWLAPRQQSTSLCLQQRSCTCAPVLPDYWSKGNTSTCFTGADGGGGYTDYNGTMYTTYNDYSVQGYTALTHTEMNIFTFHYTVNSEKDK